MVLSRYGRILAITSLHKLFSKHCHILALSYEKKEFTILLFGVHPCHQPGITPSFFELTPCIKNFSYLLLLRPNPFTGTLSGLRQILATGRPLEVTKNHFTLPFLLSRYLNFLF